jgi:hypothetical protein
MIALIISILLSVGIINCPDDYHNAPENQKKIYVEICEDIIGEDLGLI